MSSTARKVVLFGVVLVVVFVVGVALGGWLDPDHDGGDRMGPHGSMGGDPGSMGAHGGGHRQMDGAGEMPHMGAGGAPVRGLGPTENGLRLIVADRARTAGATAPLRFRVVEEDGGTIADFDELHTKRMHLIVVRRDLTGFQHLHPRMSADGTWSTPLRLETAGLYRAFADFSHDDEPTTLAGDLRVAGSPELEPLPDPANTVESAGGYEVDLDAVGLRAGQPAELRFAIARGGEPAALQSYLGAGGHLVALREGDLAFLHVHPEGRGGGRIAFEATFPSAGSYRLFLQFKVAGVVETVAFTVEVS